MWNREREARGAPCKTLTLHHSTCTSETACLHPLACTSGTGAPPCSSIRAGSPRGGRPRPAAGPLSCPHVSPRAAPPPVHPFILMAGSCAVAVEAVAAVKTAVELLGFLSGLKTAVNGDEEDVLCSTACGHRETGNLSTAPARNGFVANGGRPLACMQWPTSCMHAHLLADGCLLGVRGQRHAGGAHPQRLGTAASQVSGK